MQTRPRRPTGITVLAILSILIGIFLLLVGITVLVGSAITGVAAMANVSSGVLAGIGAFALILGILGLIMGVGFLHGRPYGWYLGIIVSVLMIIYAIVQIVLGSYTDVIELVIYGIILWYLTRPHVKAYFGKSPMMATPMTTPGYPSPGVPGPTGYSTGGGMPGSTTMGTTSNMVRCPSCGSNVAAGTMKCPNCGANL